MADITIELEAWTAFRTPNFAIQPELLAKTHSFAVDSTRVSVMLPGAPRPSHVDDEVIRLTSWSNAEGERVPLQYSVGQVSIAVSIPGTHRLPEGILTRNPNAVDMVQEDQQEKLKNVAEEHYRIAEHAMDIWSRTMRWKTAQWRLARPEHLTAETGWGSTLRQTGTGQRLWTRSKTIFVSFNNPTTPEQWEAAGSSLVAGEAPPVFVDLLFDAEAHLDRGDLRRAVIDAAVAAEIFIRTTVRRARLDKLGDRAREGAPGEPIKSVMMQQLPRALENLHLPPLTKSERRVFHMLRNARNELLHAGHATLANAVACKTFLSTLRGRLASYIG